MLKYASIAILSGVGIGISSYFLSTLLKKTVLKKEISEEDAYKNKYYDDFDKLEKKEMNKEQVKSMINNVLYENTPRGRVLMYYDSDKESFMYYCDTKDLPYLFLETVARKYALVYDCKDIVIDIKNELLEAIKVRDDNKEADKNKNQIDDKKSKGIYANFKNYNVKGVNAKNTSTRSIICDNSNRYSYKGKVNEYSILKTDDYKSKKETPMSYEKFKEMMNKKK